VVNIHPRRFGPSPRDDLVVQTTARLADVALPEAPAFTAPSPHGRTITVGGLDVFLRSTPGPAGLTPTWYIHGLEGSSRNWDRLAAVLAGHGAGNAVDLPGSGLSAPSRNRGSVAADARLVARLISLSGGEPVHLVGNSRGGMVATVLAAEFPELVRTLTLISPAVPDFRVVGERGASARLALVMMPGAVRPLTRLLDSIAPEDRARGLALTCFGEPEMLTAADLAAAAEDNTARQAAPWASENAVRSLRSLIRAQLRPGKWSFSAAARAVTHPTLVVWGTRDRLVDCRLARRTAAAFADSRLLMLEKTGHVAQMERPVAVARAVVALREDEAACSRRAGAPVSSPPRVVGT
jgi:pimeloyl-ACP methyl ester carboxylesterase